MIEGVLLRDVTMRRDERGHLGELYSENFGDSLRHVYRCMVRPGVAKAFHAHLKQTDRFTPISGVVKVGLVDLRGPVVTRIEGDDEARVVWWENFRLMRSLECACTWKYHGIDGTPKDFWDIWDSNEAWIERVGESPTFFQQQTVILDASQPQVLFIPPGVAHGIYALNGECAEILNAPTVAYQNPPDELRIPANSFGFVWPPESR